MKREIPDCLTCGVCCVCPVDQEYYCDMTPEDMDRLSKKFIHDNVMVTSMFDMLAMAIDGNRVLGGAIRTKWRTMRSGPFKGYEMNTCAALRGSLMGKVSCAIYKNRPEACRIAVEPGDKSCKDTRHAFFQTIKDLKLPDGDGLYRAYLHGVR